jgi:protein SCO1/2
MNARRSGRILHDDARRRPATLPRVGRLNVRHVAAVVVCSLPGVLAASAAAGSGPAFVGPTISHPQVAPGFALNDQNGKIVRLSGERGKVVLITFLYTHCPDLCPLTASNLNTALGLLGRQRAHVAVLAISVDPKGDTPASVTKFVKEHGLRPQFHYLTGSKAALERIWRIYNVTPVSPGAPNPDHTLYTLVLDRTGTTRVLFDATAQPAAVAHDVKLLLAQR